MIKNKQKWKIINNFKKIKIKIQKINLENRFTFNKNKRKVKI